MYNEFNPKLKLKFIFNYWESKFIENLDSKSHEENFNFGGGKKCWMRLYEFFRNLIWVFFSCKNLMRTSCGPHEDLSEILMRTSWGPHEVVSCGLRLINEDIWPRTLVEFSSKNERYYEVVYRPLKSNDNKDIMKAIGEFKKKLKTHLFTSYFN